MFNQNLYNTTYHKEDISRAKFLITGGAGFIGSNLVEYLLKYGAGHVRVLDNLSNGYMENIEAFLSLPNFEFMEGDIRDLKTCQRAVEGMDFISHQAALGSVPRSIKDPITTNQVNISGFLNMLVAAKDSPSCRRLVYAASSSTYGDSIALPKVEGQEGKLLSPYAVTKAVNESYADVFSRVYSFNTIGLRYFNVFGPKQNPNNPYAAVIPIFCRHFIEGTSPTINGDGHTSRDFTFIENVVQANIKALELGTPDLDEGDNKPKLEKHEVFNTACGDQVSLNEVIEILQEVSGKIVKVNYSQEREGDIRHSKASIEKLKHATGYFPLYRFKDGLTISYKWYEQQKL